MGVMLFLICLLLVIALRENSWLWRTVSMRWGYSRPQNPWIELVAVIDFFAYNRTKYYANRPLD